MWLQQRLELYYYEFINTANYLEALNVWLKWKRKKKEKRKQTARI